MWWVPGVFRCIKLTPHTTLSHVHVMRPVTGRMTKETHFLFWCQSHKQNAHLFNVCFIYVSWETCTTAPFVVRVCVCVWGGHNTHFRWLLSRVPEDVVRWGQWGKRGQRRDDHIWHGAAMRRVPTRAKISILRGKKQEQGCKMKCQILDSSVKY